MFKLAATVRDKKIIPRVASMWRGRMVFSRSLSLSLSLASERTILNI